MSDLTRRRFFGVLGAIGAACLAAPAALLSLSPRKRVVHIDRGLNYVRNLDGSWHLQQLGGHSGKDVERRAMEIYESFQSPCPEALCLPSLIYCSHDTYVALEQHARQINSCLGLCITKDQPAKLTYRGRPVVESPCTDDLLGFIESRGGVCSKGGRRRWYDVWDYKSRPVLIRPSSESMEKVLNGKHSEVSQTNSPALG